MIYSPHYDICMFGMERLHPFDGRKYSRAWDLLRTKLGGGLDNYWEQPQGPVSNDVLRLVHRPDYLDALGSSSAAIARAVELPLLRLVPHFILEPRLLAPMRYAVQGTILATERALQGHTVMNFGGGFHHAFADHGEGFCLFADVAVAIQVHRASGLLKRHDTLMVIDLDAHRGNGFFSIFETDPAIHILDLYNAQRYPGFFPGDLETHPFQVPLRSGLRDDAYLESVNEELLKFMEAVKEPKIAFFNAGTDIIAGDKLGGLAVSYAGVAARDRKVVDALAARRIPTVIVTSGGYSSFSHQLIADLALYLIEGGR